MFKKLCSPLRSVIRKLVIKKLIFVSLGMLFFLLGVLGMFLPVLPGVYFIIIGLGFLFRAFPSLFLILKIFRLDDKIAKELSLKSKAYIITGIWTPFIVTFTVTYFLKGNDLISDPKYLFSLFVLAVPVLLSIWILKIRSIAEVLGYQTKNRKKVNHSNIP